MKKIVCFSACNKIAQKNYERTVLESIPLEELYSFGYKEKSDNITTRYSLWGIRNIKYWEKINPGDISLFYIDKKFLSIGEILFKSINSDLSEYYWGNKSFKHIVFMKKHTIINSTREKFWDAFKYSDNYAIQGITIPSINLQKKLFERHNDIYGFLDKVIVNTNSQIY